MITADTAPFPKSYEDAYNLLLSEPVYGLPQAEKSRLLCHVTSLLHQHHLTHCDAYHQLFASSTETFHDYSDLPNLAVRLFKLMHLSSVAPQNVFKTLQSSGTTGQVTAKVTLDKETSGRQSKALVTIMQQFIGKQRLPMLIIDSPDVLKSPHLSARGAGVGGMAFFGRGHTYALNTDMTLNHKAVKEFADKYAGQPVLVFGFTFMVWLHFVEALKADGIALNLSKGILIHSGGWKKLQDKQVSNRQFKDTVRTVTAITKVHNFYGMAEQVGSVFVECEEGHLHAPSLADVVIRDPRTLATCGPDEPGIIQVISALPHSYPGYSLLTEDRGKILGEDDCACGRKGRYFEVTGRLPKAELRGCSDTAGGTV